MTTTICPQPIIASPEDSAGPAATSPRQSTLVWLQNVADRMTRGAARFWGSGSETPTSRVLDAIDVPSFDR